MVKAFLREDDADVIDHKYHIFGLDSSLQILNFFVEQIQAIVLIPAAIFLFSDNYPKEALIFVGIIVLDSVNSEICDKLYAICLIDETFYPIFNIGINVV